MIDKINDLIYQKRCYMCGNLMTYNTVSCMCIECRKNLFPINGKVCRLCGLEKEYCECSGSRNVYEAITAPFYYYGLMRNIIHRFKFREGAYLSEPLAHAMVRSMAHRYYRIDFDMIMFVPMTRKKERKRGYNQSKLLAERISEMTYLPVLKGILIKRRETKNQHDLSYHERLDNLHGSYEITDKSVIKGKTILLCDDVKTTGATLNECAFELRINGAKAVYSICAAVNPSLKWKIERNNELNERIDE